MSGVDTLGGIIYGFDKGSEERSKCFMKDHMNIKEELAKFIYISVRCGIFHHGMPRMGVYYELWYDEEWMVDDAFCKNEDKKFISINVAKLAKQYLKTVYNIKEDFNKNPSKFKAGGFISWLVNYRYYKKQLADYEKEKDKETARYAVMAMYHQHPANNQQELEDRVNKFLDAIKEIKKDKRGVPVWREEGSIGIYWNLNFTDTMGISIAKEVK